MTDTNPMLLHALTYLEYGWSVIPINPQTKKPLVKWKNGAKNYQAERATPEEVRQWWQRWPDANIGIVTGAVSGIVVLDCDSDEAIRFFQEHGLPDTPCSKTARGIHYIFKHPGFRVGNHTKDKSDPDDPADFRGDGGYIVAPPSIHHSGSHYEWIIHPSTMPFASMPGWLITFLHEKKTAANNGAIPVPASKPESINPAVLEALLAYAQSQPHSVDKKGWINLSCPISEDHEHGDASYSFGVNIHTGVGYCFGGHGAISPERLCRYWKIDPAPLGGVRPGGNGREQRGRGKLASTPSTPVQAIQQPTLELKQARAKLESAIHDFITAKGKRRALVIPCIPGIGKTRAAFQEAERLAWAGRKVAILVGNRLDDETGAELARKFEVDPKLFYFYEARSDVDTSKGYCRQKADCDTMAEKGHNAYQHVCKHCDWQVDCELKGYLAQQKAARHAPILVLRHEHARIEDLLKGREVIFIDESPLSVIEASHKYVADDFKITITPLIIPGSEDAPKDEAACALVNRLCAALKRVLDTAPEPPENGHLDDRHMLLGGKQFFDRLIAALNGEEGVFNGLYGYVYNRAENAAREAKLTNTAPLLRIIKDEYERYYKAGRERWNSRLIIEGKTLLLHEMRPIQFGATRKVVVLDATPNITQYKRAFTDGRQFFAIEELDIQIERKGVITVFTGSEYSRTTLGVSSIKEITDTEGNTILAYPPNADYERLKRFILRIADRHGEQPLIITYHKLARVLCEWAISINLDGELFTWFGANRGSNKWEKTQAVVVIGTPRIPEMEARKLAQIWHWDDPDPVSFEQAPTTLHYPGYVDPQDKQGRMWQTPLGYADPRVQAMVDHTIKAELQQSAGRVRPDTSVREDDEEKPEPRYVYFVTAYPCYPYVNRLIDHLQWELDTLIEDYTLRATGRVTITDMVKWFGRTAAESKKRQEGRYSDDTIREACKRVWARLEREGQGRILESPSTGKKGRPTTAFEPATIRLFASIPAQKSQIEHRK